MKKEVKMSEFSTFTSGFMTVFAIAEAAGHYVDKITMNEECYVKLRIQRLSEFTRSVDKKSCFFETAPIEISESGPYAIFTLSNKEEIKLLN